MASHTCSGWILIVPTNSKKFNSNDFANRLRINLRSSWFPVPVGVVGGVYICSMPSSSGGSSFLICHKILVPLILNLTDKCSVAFNILVGFVQMFCKLHSLVVLGVAEIAIQLGHHEYEEEACKVYCWRPCSLESSPHVTSRSVQDYR